MNLQQPTHPDSEKAQRFVEKEIYEYLMLRGKQQSNDLSEKRRVDLTRFLSKALFNAASSLDEYMDLDTLETRLLFHLKQIRNSQNQRVLQNQFQQMNLGLGDQNQQQVQPQQQQIHSAFGDQNQQFVQHGNSSGSISTSQQQVI